MKISLIYLSPILITMNSYARHRPAYDTLKTAGHIPGLHIAILHEAPRTSTTGYPVLFLHGSVIPVNVSFGLRMNNYSWMDNLDDNGFDVYALTDSSSSRHPGMIHQQPHQHQARHMDRQHPPGRPDSR